MPLSRLPQTGDLFYNGIRFNSTEKIRVRAKPELDEARRIVKYTAYHISFSGYVAAEPPAIPTTDDILEGYRERLLELGQPFVFEKKGFGRLIVNTGTPEKDALWGPAPEILTWAPLGNDRAAYVEWACVVHLPCERSSGTGIFERALMAMNYEEEWDIDQDGYTVQRIHGYLEIPMTRQAGSRFPPDTADRYRERIRPEVPLGFQRANQHFRLSKNRNRLDFAFTDNEIPAPLPEGATRCEVRHSVRSSLVPDGFINWHGMISGSVTLARGEPRSLVWDKFSLVLAQRLSHARSEVQVAGVGRNGGVVLLQNLFVEEEVFGRPSHFSVGYTIIGVPLSKIFAVAGLWRPVDGTDFNKWRGSLANTAHHVRGTAKLAHSPLDDALVDICVNDRPVVPQKPGTPPPHRPGTPPNPPRAPRDSSVPPKDSWLRYRLRILLREIPRRVPHKPLTLPPVERDPPSSSDGFFIGIERDDTSPLQPSTRPAPPPTTTTPGAGVVAVGGGLALAAETARASADIVQEVASPGYTIVLEGEATRVGHPVPCPSLDTIGGVEPVLMRRDYVKGMVGGMPGVPVHGAAWRLEYYLPTAPSGAIPTPGNPALGLESEST